MVILSNLSDIGLVHLFTCMCVARFIQLSTHLQVMHLSPLLNCKENEGLFSNSQTTRPGLQAIKDGGSSY